MLTQEQFIDMIAKMKELSPSVAQNMDNQTYKTLEITDASDMDVILSSCVEYLFKDLYEIGIHINNDTNDMFENNYDIFSSLNILSYLVPTTLYKKLKDDKHLYKLLYDLIYNPVSDDRLILSYMYALGGTSDNQSYDVTTHSGYLYLSDRLMNDPTYTTVIKRLLDMIVYNDSEIELDSEELTNYTSYVVYINKLMYNASLLLKKHITNEDDLFVALDRRLHLVYKQFNNPNNITLYNFVFCQKHETEIEKNIYKRKRKEVFSSLKVSPMYHVRRKLELTKLDILGYMCFIYTLYKIKELPVKFDVLINIANSNPDLKDFIDKVINIITKEESEE